MTNEKRDFQLQRELALAANAIASVRNAGSLEAAKRLSQKAYEHVSAAYDLSFRPVTVLVDRRDGRP